MNKTKKRSLSPCGDTYRRGPCILRFVEDLSGSFRPDFYNDSAGYYVVPLPIVLPPISLFVPSF
jgi:hypothetical protein